VSDASHMKSCIMGFQRALSSFRGCSEGHACVRQSFVLEARHTSPTDVHTGNST